MLDLNGGRAETCPSLHLGSRVGTCGLEGLWTSTARWQALAPPTPPLVQEASGSGWKRGQCTQTQERTLRPSVMGKEAEQLGGLLRAACSFPKDGILKDILCI